MKFDDSLKERADNAIRSGKKLKESFHERSRQNVVLWLDLLGFHNNFLIDEDSALLRLSVFHDLTLTTVSDELHIAQLNDATSKSYFLESSGELLKEPSLYIEECLINNYEIMVSPHWVDHGRFYYKSDRYVIV